MASFLIGRTIMIECTDGHQQTAEIAKFNEYDGSVTVKWFANGEIKGKVVDLNSIITLNPELIRGPDVPRKLKKRPMVIDRTARTSKNRNSFGVVTNMRGTTTTAIASSPITGNCNGRRSRVVTVMERLREHREKRREYVATLREEKNALLHFVNPNWETEFMIRNFQNSLKYAPLTDEEDDDEHQITVCVRKRPLNSTEINRGELDVVIIPRKDTMIVHEPRNKVDLKKYLRNHKFAFDYAFDTHCDNATVYKYTAQPLVQTIFDGGNATCFAYGQTGAGKTHTMGGEFNGDVQDCSNGIYAMAAADVFLTLEKPEYRNMDLYVTASFFEIYGGKVFDLLANKKKLRVLENGQQQVQVIGLTEIVVERVDDVLQILQHGNITRACGQTSANENSSRSHAVFQIQLRKTDTNIIHGKFSFVDLAGNERGADAYTANRQTRMESGDINKSLLALKECIRALGKQSAHLPFRVSQLTQVLRDSFIGEKSKTCMIAMVSPGLVSCENTLNTLRYADRVKELVVPEISYSLKCSDSDEPVSDKMNTNSYEDITRSSTSNLSFFFSLSEHMSEDQIGEHTEFKLTAETVMDYHRGFNEYVAEFLLESQRLLKMTEDDQYDCGTYTEQILSMLKQMNAMCGTSCIMMTDFHAKLVLEGKLSSKFTPTV